MTLISKKNKRLAKNLGESRRIYESAKQNNKEINQIQAQVNEQKEKIDKVGDLLTRVSNNFKELEIFRGRYLKHIYDHKMEVEVNQR